jgi:MFS family permease
MRENTTGETAGYRWKIFWAVAVAYIFVYFHRMCPAVLAVDMMKDLRTGAGMVGLLSAAYFYSYAIMQLPAGLLSDTWGPRKTITAFFLLAFAGCIILAVSNSVGIAIVGRTLVGIGVAMLFVPALKLFSEWFEADRFATMTGYLLAVGGVGSIAATFPLAMMTSLIGWRWSFVLIGAITLGISLLIWHIVRDHPTDLTLTMPPRENVDETPSQELFEGIGMILANRHFWYVGICIFSAAGTFFAFAGLWGGPYMIQVHTMTTEEAGWILSTGSVGAIIGAPLFSFLSNRVFQSRKIPILIAMIGLIVITSGLGFFTTTLTEGWLYLLCLGLGIVCSGIAPVAYATIKELFPLNISGRAIGLINLFPFAGGAVLQPLIGYILEGHRITGGEIPLSGFSAGFRTLLICGLVGLIAGTRVRETFPGKRLRSSG